MIMLLRGAWSNYLIVSSPHFSATGYGTLDLPKQSDCSWQVTACIEAEVTHRTVLLLAEALLVQRLKVQEC